MNYNSTLSRFFFAASALLFITLGLNAQNIPDGYYDRAEGLSNKTLKTALSSIIKDKDVQSYGDGTWRAFEKSDKLPDGSVWDKYSYTKRYFPGNGNAPGGMNIEHSVAQSWFSEARELKCDLHHLFPSDSKANSRRGNYPLGTTNTAAASGESIKVGKNTYSSSYTGQVWEPLDEYKGDFARAYLYMFTCYENINWTSASTNVLTSSGTWPMLKDWYQDMLLEWCRMDPPSEQEINRAEVVYEVQGNRNPFIDHPELVEYLWGDLVGEPFAVDTTLPMITSPSSSSTLTLPTIHFSETSKFEIEVKGKNLTSNVTISLSGADAALFTINKTTLSAADVNDGTIVTATFDPAVAGTYTATLSIVSSEVTNTKTVTLKAEATENFIALSPSDITSSSFTAKWSEHSYATSYELNLYKKTSVEHQEIEIVNEAMDSKPASWTTTGYVSFNDGAAKLASGSQSGTIKIPNLNLVTESVITIYAKRYNNDSSTLKVYVDDTLVDSPVMTSEYETYKVALPAATSTSTITLSASSDKRLYIDNIIVVTGGTVETLEQVENYPVNCGKETSYTVTNLDELSTYAYEITAKWSNGSETTELSTIETVSSTGINNTDITNIVATGNNGAIALQRLTVGSTVEVYSVTGALISLYNNSTESMVCNVPQRGIYVVRISDNENSTILKVAVK